MRGTCIASFSLGSNQSDIGCSLIIEQLNAQLRDDCPRFFVKSTDPGLCGEENLTRPGELAPASHSCRRPTLLFVLTREVHLPREVLTLGALGSRVDLKSSVFTVYLAEPRVSLEGFFTYC